MAVQSVNKHAKSNLEDGQSRVDITTTLDKVIIAVAEFIGTTVFVFVACMGCVPNPNEDTLMQQPALISGLALMITMFLFGHISGAYVNPLTSLSAVIVGQTPLGLLPIYLIAEFVGALSGYGLLKLVTPIERMAVSNGTHGVCTTIPNPNLTSMQALMVEIILSVILSIANCSSWDPKNAKNLDSAPLKFGFLVGTLTMAGGNYTGAGMNPFKSFAPALWNRDWERHWIYWVGPLSSAVFVSFGYRILFLSGKGCREVARPS